MVRFLDRNIQQSRATNWLCAGCAGLFVCFVFVFDPFESLIYHSTYSSCSLEPIQKKQDEPRKQKTNDRRTKQHEGVIFFQLFCEQTKQNSNNHQLITIIAKQQCVQQYHTRPSARKLLQARHGERDESTSFHARRRPNQRPPSTYRRQVTRASRRCLSTACPSPLQAPSTVWISCGGWPVRLRGTKEYIRNRPRPCLMMRPRLVWFEHACPNTWVMCYSGRSKAEDLYVEDDRRASDAARSCFATGRTRRR